MSAIDPNRPAEEKTVPDVGDRVEYINSTTGERKAGELIEIRGGFAYTGSRTKSTPHAYRYYTIRHDDGKVIKYGEPASKPGSVIGSIEHGSVE